MGKKAKENAAAAAEAEKEGAALQASSAPSTFEPPARPAAKEAPKSEAAADGPSSGAFDNPEVEKQVRKLQKTLRQIQTLKEKPEKELDKLQKEKIQGEADIIRQ